MKELLKEGLKITNFEDLEEIQRGYMRQGNLKRALAVRGILLALQGNFDALNSLTDHVDGKLQNNTKMSGDPEAPMFDGVINILPVSTKKG